MYTSLLTNVLFYGSLSNENKNSTDCSKHVWKNNIKNNKLDWTSNLNDVSVIICLFWEYSWTFRDQNISSFWSRWPSHALLCQNFKFKEFKSKESWISRENFKKHYRKKNYDFLSFSARFFGENQNWHFESYWNLLRLWKSE